jgi:2-dehydro-3-deoxyphosphooctonate aldolase (KDO 8-P synthase)
MMKREKKSSAEKSVTVNVGSLKVGRGCPFLLIAGPCVIESERSLIRHAVKLKKMTDDLNIPFVFKASYDKANRSSASSYRGPGIKRGLDMLNRLKREVGVMVLSDVHTPEQVEYAAKVLDIIQIPALLCRQTDLIVEAAKTGKVINVKKGQFMAPNDMRHVVDKILRTGNNKILLTERGTSFGYNTLVSDFRSLIVMGKFGFPVVFDATHSIQQPGGLGSSSGGEREYAPALARAAIAVGCDGLFIEVHENPDKALSDGPNMISMSDLKNLLKGLRELSDVSRRIVKFR